MRLDGLHEQAITRRLSHEHLVQLHCVAHKRGSQLVWLDKGTSWLVLHDGNPGRLAVFSDAAIQFFLTVKGLFKLPLRQTKGMVCSWLGMVGLDCAVPYYAKLCRR